MSAVDIALAILQMIEGQVQDMDEIELAEFIQSQTNQINKVDSEVEIVPENLIKCVKKIKLSRKEKRGLF